MTTPEPWQAARLSALSVGQVISWGILFYAMIVAAPAVAGDTGWPLTVVTALFSVGLIASALVGVPVGRRLDRHGPRGIMTLGSATGSAGLAIVALAPDPVWFGVGWVIAGSAQAAVLYQAAFTVLARRYRTRRRAAMTVLTLAGGLASTVFAPIVAGLLAVTDWRTTFLVLAGALAITTIPLHWFTLEARWEPLSPPTATEPDLTVAGVLRTRRFRALTLATMLLAASLYMVTLALIPLFMEKGLDYTLSAWALGLLGAGQVIGRLIYVAIPHAAAPWVPLAATAGLAAVMLALLAVTPGPAWLLIAIAIAAGAVRGAQTLVQGSSVAERWGTRSYGAINGVFAAPITIISALGPALGPVAAAAAGGYAAMALVAAVAALAAAALARLS
ncbi:MFS transporter [Microbacterium sp. JZ31]|uniref:MFS transporter n=1 Tax=Microbacterium sp. JZ31 TaxID=1906274 RepID=UPI001931F2EF|nr:MFS transporter [Microbacterium sp. JZ31]